MSQVHAQSVVTLSELQNLIVTRTLVVRSRNPWGYLKLWGDSDEGAGVVRRGLRKNGNQGGEGSGP